VSNLPQDTRSPHQQQRWLELVNVGSSSIPSGGVCEVVGSMRDAENQATILQVRRPIADCLPNVVINGPLRIPSGKSARIGTNDYPAWAFYNNGDGTPMSGQMWGSVKDSFALGKGRQGFTIAGDPFNGVPYEGSSNASFVRVLRSERLLRVSPYSDPLAPGQTVDCFIHYWDGTNWLPTNSVVPVKDPFFRTAALPGEIFVVEAYGLDLQPIAEFGLRRRGVITTTIYPNTTGEVALRRITPGGNASCVGDLSGFVVDACYRTSSGSSLSGTTANPLEVFVHYHPEFKRWFILPVGGTGTKNIRFEMLSALPLGGKGTAIEVTSGPAYDHVGDPFPIKDPYSNPGMFRYDPGQSTQRGYMGFCCVPDNPEFEGDEPIREIIEMEQLAESINFTLSGDIAGDGTLEGEAEVDMYYIGKNPTTSDLVDGAAINVVDPQSNYPRALEGAKGKARYNNRFHRYEIIECNQMSPVLNVVSSPFCPSSSSVNAAAWSPMFFPPYGQKPKDVETADNTFSLASEFAATLWVWDENPEEWVCAQAKHKALYVAKDISIAADGCAIDVDLLLEEIAVMGCGNEDEDGDSLTLTSMNVVTGFSTVEPSGSGSDADLTCKIQATLQNICALPGAGGSSTADVISFTPQLAVQDIFQDGLCIGGSVVLLYVPCFSDPEDVQFICGTECDSGSGS
jgi:hypothetical protein